MTDEIPYGYFRCGCGQKTELATYSSRQRHCVRGKPLRFIQGHHKIFVNQHSVSRLPFPENFWYHVDKKGDDECWEWNGQRQNPHKGKNNDWGNYGLFYYKDKTRKAHQVSYELAHGEIPDGMFVLHKCDNPPCVNPNHLFLGTTTDNMKDMVSKGRNVCRIGSENQNSKLTNEKVVEIRKLIASKVPLRRIAKMFGVSDCPIRLIAKGITWRHVK